MSFDELKNSLIELAEIYKKEKCTDMQEFLTSEGFTGTYVYDKIPLEFLVRLNLSNGWTIHNDILEEIIFILMHIWNTEDIYRKFGEGAVDKLAYI